MPVVSVIIYSDSSNQGLFEKKKTLTHKFLVKVLGSFMKKEGKYAYLVTNTHVNHGAKKVDIL